MCQEVNVPVSAATLLLTGLLSSSGIMTFLSPPAFFLMKAQEGDFVDPLYDLLKEMRIPAGMTATSSSRLRPCIFTNGLTKSLAFQ